MYELPTKGDLDRNLSMIFHAAHHKARAECGCLKSDFAARGMSLKSTSLIGVVVESIDTIHKEALAQAMPAVLDFAERMQVSPKQIIPRARTHLQNLGNTLLAQIPPAGFPAEQQRIMAQYRLVFQQRLDGALRDIEIGFIGGRSLTPSHSDRPVPSPPTSRELVSLKLGFWGMSIDLKEFWRRFRQKWERT
ncbi:MAG: hypothetical protein ACREC0_11130 [Methylocella sp.]